MTDYLVNAQFIGYWVAIQWQLNIECVVPEISIIPPQSHPTPLEIEIKLHKFLL